MHIYNFFLIFFSIMVYPRILDIVNYSMGFPGGSAGKESACNAETWVLSLGWEDPWGRKRLHTPVFWPGEFHGLFSLWGRKESDMTETFTCSAILYNKILFMRSIQNSLHLLYPNSQSIPLSPLIFVIIKLQFPHLYNRLKPHRLFWELNIIIQLDFHTVDSNNSKCMN